MKYKIIFVVFLIVLFFPVVKGINYDNIGVYDESISTMTIKDNFGLGDTLAKITLLSPHEVDVIKGNNRLVAWYQIENYEKNNNVFGAIQTLKYGTMPFSKEIKLKFADPAQTQTKITPSYATTCTPSVEPPYPNGTRMPDVCITKKTGEEMQTIYGWENKYVDTSQPLPIGTYVVGLFADVNAGDNVEWIPNVYGVDIPQWATWNETFSKDLAYYYKFDESSGATVAHDEKIMNNDITVNLGRFQTGGVINNFLNTTSNGELNGTSANNVVPSLTAVGNRTINFWSITNNYTTGTRGIVGWGGTGAAEGFDVLIVSGTYWVYTYNAGTDMDTNMIVNNSLKMHTITYNGTAIRYYLNGVFIKQVNPAILSTTATKLYIGQRFEQPTVNYNGTIDELGIWNRSLSQSEITNLYNGGLGLEYAGGNVILDSPANSLETLNSQLFFSADYVTFSTFVNFTNSTLYIWNSDTSLFQQNRTNITGVTNSTNLSLSNFVRDKTYVWNYYGCGRRADNSHYCEFALTNRTFSRISYEENNQNFSKSIYDTERDTYRLNITFETSLYNSATAVLVYNTTRLTATTTTGTGNQRMFTRLRSIPVINEPYINYTFYWEVALTNTSTTIKYNTTMYNQTVLYSNFSNCGIGARAVNYTFFDEETKKQLTSDFGGTFKWRLNLSTEFSKNFSYNTTNTNAQFCINANKTFYTDVSITLESGGYNSRHFGFNDEPFINNTKHQPLYLLNDTLGTAVTIKLVNLGQIPLEGYTIKIFRKLDESGSEIMVENDITDNFGRVSARVIERTVRYRLEFYDTNNTLVKHIDDALFICESATCVQTYILEDNVDWYGEFETIPNHYSTLTFNNNTNIFSYVWLDETGISSTHRLLVERKLFNGTTIVSGCNKTETSDSGVINCDVGTQKATYTAQAFRQATGSKEIRLWVLDAEVGNLGHIFGTEGLFWGFVVTITSIMLGIFYPPAGIVLFLLGNYVFGYVLDIMYINWFVFVAEIVVGALFIRAFRG